MAGSREVNDGEPPMAETAVPLYIDPFIIRAPVGEDLTHLPDQSRIYRFILIKIELAADSAHF
jgi:hypothetical protein